MKLRILDNSIRVRVDRSEVRQLLREQSVERRTVFGPDHAFVYALHAVPQNPVLLAKVGHSRIDVWVDVIHAIRWACSSETSLKVCQSAGGAELHLLLEKDFPCQHSVPGDAEEKFTPTRMHVDADVSGPWQYENP